MLSLRMSLFNEIKGGEEGDVLPSAGARPALGSYYHAPLCSSYIEPLRKSYRAVHKRAQHSVL